MLGDQVAGPFSCPVAGRLCEHLKASAVGEVHAGDDARVVAGCLGTSREKSTSGLRLAPSWLRVMPGTLMLEGRGELLTWRESTGSSA